MVMCCPLPRSVPDSHSASPAKYDSEVAVADLVPECVVNAWMCVSKSSPGVGAKKQHLSCS